MVLLTHLMTSSYMMKVLQLLLFFGSEKCNSNEIQTILPSRDCTRDFNDCEKEGRPAGSVCGQDGNSYLSACHLFYRACIDGRPNQIGYSGDCQYQFLENEVARKRVSLAEDTSSSSSSEEVTGGGKAGSGDTGHQGGDDEDDPDEDTSDEDSTTPRPNPPTFLPKPSPMYCADKPGPLYCKCENHIIKPPPFLPDYKLPELCRAGRKCMETNTIPPKIPEIPAPPVQSSLPMGARVAVAFSSIAFASMMAVVGFRVYSSRTIRVTRNRQASDDSRNQTEMTSRTFGTRSGSVQTYTSVA